MLNQFLFNYSSCLFSSVSVLAGFNYFTISFQASRLSKPPRAAVVVLSTTTIHIVTSQSVSQLSVHRRIFIVIFVLTCTSQLLPLYLLDIWVKFYILFKWPKSLYQVFCCFFFVSGQTSQSLTCKLTNLLLSCAQTDDWLVGRYSYCMI